MIKWKNKWIPPGDYHCLTVWPILFYKGELDALSLAHEKWHEKQYLVCLLIGVAIYGFKNVLFGDFWDVAFMILPFLLFYIAWAVGFWVKGYDKMGLEVSADKHEHDDVSPPKTKIL